MLVLVVLPIDGELESAFPKGALSATEVGTDSVALKGSETMEDFDKELENVLDDCSGAAGAGAGEGEADFRLGDDVDNKVWTGGTSKVGAFWSDAEVDGAL